MANHDRDFEGETDRAWTKNRRKHKGKFVEFNKNIFIFIIKIYLLFHKYYLIVYFFQTMEWVSKFSEQLYPVITSVSHQTENILQDLVGSKDRILPELNKAVDELDSRIKGLNALAQKGTRLNSRDTDINNISDDSKILNEILYWKGEVQIEDEILKRLRQMHENLRTTARDYENLLESLISIFKNIEEVYDWNN